MKIRRLRRSKSFPHPSSSPQSFISQEALLLIVLVICMSISVVQYLYFKVIRSCFFMSSILVPVDFLLRKMLIQPTATPYIHTFPLPRCSHIFIKSVLMES